MNHTRTGPNVYLLAGTVFATLASVTLAAPPDESVFFEKKVRPILADRCFACHGSEKQKGGLRVDSRPALLTGGDRGAAINLRQPASSLLLRALNHGEDLKMPPRNKLPAVEIAVIKEWLLRGAPWPATRPVTSPVPKNHERSFTAAEKAFWAFQPVKRPVVPTVPRPGFPIRNPIDNFILAKLGTTGLKPAAEAEKRTLFRRVTLDLTGLPPTPEETETFLNDPSPRAYENWVEHLLASPAYGEKWGRRWLDVARYADSNGMDENLAYTNAWRYRDWVIRSFNADKPYDEFVREQLAGDLLPGKTETERADHLTATGFLVIGPKMLAEDDPVKMRMDIIDEQLDTLGQVFMGLTLGCARCHDHKFDPITMADYYGLAGILYSTRTMKNYSVVATWNERPIGTPSTLVALAEQEKRVVALRAEIAAIAKEAKATTAATLTKERQRAAEYLAAAVEIARRRRPLKPLVSDLDRKLPTGAVQVESEAFARGNVLRLTDGYGAGIGVIINAGPLPNYAEYDVKIATAGTYQLVVRYAAAESRPVQIMANGQLIAREGCGSRTGSWNPDTQMWAAEGILTLPAGKTVLRFEREGPFPHLDKFALLPMTPEQAARAPLSVAQVATERRLLASALGEWVEVIAKRQGRLPTDEERHRIATAADGPFRITPTAEKETQSRYREQLHRLRAALAALEKTRPPVEEVMAVEDGKGETLRIHLRGNHLTLGAEAPRRFPRILGGDKPLSLGTDRSGRRELAEWLTQPDHPLTARVMVNRLWAGHFGAGLVRSPDNFGRLGERPTHPELLDWLAAEFVQAKWSIKHLHRLIVTSTVYRLGSQADPAALATDPENRLLSHYNRRRLDAEEIRDGMLAVAGLLDRKSGGSLLTVGPRQYVTGTGNRNYEGYAHPRRSVYLPVIRSALYDVFQTLDFPDPSVPSGQRTATTVPGQALMTLNSPLADQTAEAFARSLLAHKGTEKDRVHEAYRRAFGRAPNTRELDRVLAYLTKSQEHADPRLASQARQLQAWRGLCRVLLGSNEFVFVE